MAEKEYIERRAFAERLRNFSEWCRDGRKQGVDFVLDCPLPNMPAADVVEVVHGEWVWDDNAIDWGLGAWVCSRCRTKNENIGAGKPGYDHSVGRNPYAWAGSKYCPQCGVKMGGGTDNVK